jgi:hypothetical protein
MPELGSTPQFVPVAGAEASLSAAVPAEPEAPPSELESGTLPNSRQPDREPSTSQPINQRIASDTEQGQRDRPSNRLTKRPQA